MALRELYSKLTFYDALHASLTLNRAGVLISNDKAYDKIAGLKRTSFDDFVVAIGSDQYHAESTPPISSRNVSNLDFVH